MLQMKKIIREVLEEQNLETKFDQLKEKIEKVILMGNSELGFFIILI